MQLMIWSQVQHFDGLIDVDVSINKKIYSFTLTSEYILDKVQKLIRQKCPGKALNLLKENNQHLQKEKRHE